jgi:hypothetical protein
MDAAIIALPCVQLPFIVSDCCWVGNRPHCFVTEIRSKPSSGIIRGKREEGSGEVKEDEQVST